MNNKSNNYQHRARKRFGQNFLRDKSIIQKIAHVVNAQQSDHIVEIGPGQGALTEGLLHSGCTLDAIELDRDLIPILQQHFMHHQNFNLHNSDALTFDFASLCKDNRKLRIVGNLPYNISTPLIFYLLDQQQLVQDMYFMLQREVVTRLAARAGSKQYGRLSVMTQYYCEVVSLFDVPPEAFNPIPKVQSAIVKLTPHQSPIHKAINIETLQLLLRTVFNQRRKTLRNSLKSLLDINLLKHLNIDPITRPENLTLEQFVAISNTITLTRTN